MAYQAVLRLCFDENLSHTSGKILMGSLISTNPEHYDDGLRYWLDKFERLCRVRTLQEVIVLLDEWIFTEDGKRFSDSQVKVVIMSAIIFVNACRNRMWELFRRRNITNPHVTNKHELMRHMLHYTCLIRGVRFEDMIKDTE